MNKARMVHELITVLNDMGCVQAKLLDVLKGLSSRWRLDEACPSEGANAQQGHFWFDDESASWIVYERNGSWIEIIKTSFWPRFE